MNQRREDQDISKMPKGNQEDGPHRPLWQGSLSGRWPRQELWQGGGLGRLCPGGLLRPPATRRTCHQAWAVKATPQRRRSPLPDWYPRTPLRDITAIVKAIERSRLRIAAARQESEQSLQPANLIDTVPAEDSLAIASGSGSTQIVANPAPSPDEQSFRVYSSPSKSSLKTPTKPIDPLLADLMEKKLSSSIEKIEKMVKKNMKRNPKAAQSSKRANQRHTLMSMR